MECIVHFELVRNGKPSSLRGLVDVDKGSKPSIAQLVEMFRAMDLNVSIDNEDKYTFKPVSPSERYSIRVTKFDMGQETDAPQDPHLRSIISNFMPKDPQL
ncbi:hypothetical protein [Paenibacillus sp. MSJ-34]|uniref:hypothetical protein n=1 Tax=Paenibacillus sp. MSJ-34 TaxID=2841529 RepID=UPI001C11D8AF|nr:hypothetical protein [Paenibacillus sp. MSJ-34]MBU5442351.1 hypothetical protein [Paenibacillus sp. MSJ-34]